VVQKQNGNLRKPFLRKGYLQVKLKYENTTKFNILAVPVMSERAQQGRNSKPCVTVMLVHSASHVTYLTWMLEGFSSHVTEAVPVCYHS